MKRIIFLFISLSVLFMFSNCALEIANVIGPGGGWVFDDTFSYGEKGWRYKQCAPHDFEILNFTGANGDEIVNKAFNKCIENSGGHYKWSWTLPTEAELKKMLNCFTYGLTQFKDNIYYLYVEIDDTKDLTDRTRYSFGGFYYMDFSNSSFGEAKKAPSTYQGEVRVRAIMWF